MLRTPHRRLPRSLALASVALLLASATAAQADWWKPLERRANSDLVEVLEEDGRFGILLAAVDAAGLTETLATADLTIFAPTDDAFLALGQETIDALLNDIPALTNILTYHLIDGAQYARQLSRQTSTETLQGSVVVVVRQGRAFRVNGNPIIDKNLRASNGVAQVIEVVLLPPEEETPVDSLVSVLARDGRFDILLAAAEAAGLADELAGEGPLTLFAPTDDAFAALGQDTIDALLNDIPALQNILLYHVLGDEKRASQLLIEGVSETLQGASVRTRLVNWRYIFVEDARVLNANLRGPNGVVHVIDSVLIPPPADQTVLDVLEERGYTTLVAAIRAAGLEDALLELGPVTIFAPTNEAFAELGQDTIDALLADVPTLHQILLYHVVLEEKPLIDVIFERHLETVQGSSVRSYWFFGPVFINSERVVDPNVGAPDAIIHGIDGVLIPPSS